MKYKAKLAKLTARQAAWERLSEKDKHATTKPGSKKK